MWSYGVDIYDYGAIYLYDRCSGLAADLVITFVADHETAYELGVTTSTSLAARNVQVIVSYFSQTRCNQAYPNILIV